MAIDFPNAPTTSQTFTSGGRTWIYNGSQWALQTGSYTAGTINTGSLANLAVTTAKIENYSVTAAKIANTTVTNAQIAANTITDSQIAAATITNAKLVNTAVTLGSTALTLGSTVTALTGLSNVSTSNAIINNTLYSKAVIEPTLVSATAATGTIALNFLDNAIVYYTSNASANFTLNVRGNSSVTMASLLAVGDSATVVFMSQNGATAYYANVYQIDGTAITPKWQGGNAPTSGNASSIDCYSITVIKTAATPTYTALASVVKFS
jgi:hypothetical protein